MPIDAIYYQYGDESICLYRAGDDIPVVTEEEYLWYRNRVNRYVESVPEEFEEPTEYFALRAAAFVRGEDLPDAPIQNRKTSTLSEPIGSTLSEPKTFQFPDSAKGTYSAPPDAALTKLTPTAKPSPAATAKPSPAATAKPSPAATAKPSPATTGTPEPDTRAK